MKRALDLALSVLGLCLVAPLLALITALIKLEGPGPVFYRGIRVGLGASRFRIFKFRTMVPEGEKLGGSSSADDDPRITRIGRILRRWKLDELPQLFNVLSGEMSLVGPRPQVEHDVAKYSDEEQVILSVRPGITDWSSIKFRHEGAILKGHPDPDKAYIELIRPEKIRLQLLYVRQNSILTDLKILWSTFVVLFGGSVALP